MPDHPGTKKNTMAVVITGNNLTDYSWKDIKLGGLEARRLGSYLIKVFSEHTNLVNNHYHRNGFLTFIFFLPQ